MKKYLKKLKAFSITEAVVVFAIIGIIAALAIPNLLAGNPNDDGRITMAKKMIVYLDEAMLNILIHNAPLDDFLVLNDSNGNFSIEDSTMAPRFSKLVREYIGNIHLGIDLNHEYYNKNILDYDKTPLPITLKGAYSGFFYANDGAIVGFRLYGSCDSTEMYANPPEFFGSYQVINSCGSVFIDINGYNKPNKLGSDQFIVPIYKRGLKYDNV